MAKPDQSFKWAGAGDGLLFLSWKQLKFSWCLPRNSRRNDTRTTDCRLVLYQLGSTAIDLWCGATALQARYIEPMLVYSLSSVSDAGPALNKRWFVVSPPLQREAVAYRRLFYAGSTVCWHRSSRHRVCRRPCRRLASVSERCSRQLGSAGGRLRRRRRCPLGICSIPASLPASPASLIHLLAISHRFPLIRSPCLHSINWDI